LYLGAKTSVGGFLALNLELRIFCSHISFMAIISSTFHSQIDLGLDFSQTSKANGFGTVMPF